MPQTPHFMRPRRLRRLLAAPLLLLLLALLLTGAGVEAQRRGARQQPGKKATGAQTPQNATNSNAATQSGARNGRLGSLRSNDTGSGSRVTITSDSALSDYSAYRSGDRYYVKLPKADAKAVKGGLRGRGFEDAQVEQRGDDVVLSIRLQPGASARVNQKFNRLNVEIATPGGADAPDTPDNARTAAAAAQRPADAQRNQNRPGANAPQTANANTNAAASRLTNANRAASSADPALLNNGESAATNADESFNPLTNPSAAQTAVMPDASPLVSPSVEQLAQAQPPQQPATTSAPAAATNAAPAASTGTSFVGVVLQNWPLALIATLLLVGLGLFFAARRTSATRDALPADATPTSLADANVPTPQLSSSTATATTTATTTAAATAATKTEARKTATPKTSARTTATTADAASHASPTPGVSSSGMAGALGVAGGLASAGALSSSVESGIGASNATDTAGASAAFAAAEFDSERVQTETKKLLDGESYDADVIGVTDPGMRELVAAELLAALAGRPVERRERARHAFIRYGYFDDAQKILSTAAAPAERASAARSLGLVGERAATPALVSALDDSAMEVRRASVEALAEVKDPAAVAPLEELRAREKDQKRKVPRTLIQRTIEVCAAAPAVLPVVASAAAPAAPTDTTTLDAPTDAATLDAPVDATTPEATGQAAIPTTVHETPALEAAQDETPTLVAEAPITEAPVAEAPVAEVPDAQVASAVEAPSAVETPDAETLVVESPVAETASALTPAFDTPSAEAQVAEIPLPVAEETSTATHEDESFEPVAADVAIEEAVEVEEEAEVSVAPSDAVEDLAPSHAVEDLPAEREALFEESAFEAEIESTLEAEMPVAEFETPTLEHEAPVVSEAAPEVVPVSLETSTHDAESLAAQAEARETFTPEEEGIGLPSFAAVEDEATDDVQVVAAPVAEEVAEEVAGEVKAIEPVEALRDEAGSDWIDLDMMDDAELTYDAHASVASSDLSAFEPSAFEPTAFEPPPAPTHDAPMASSYQTDDPPIEAESPLKSLREAASERRIDIFTPAAPAPPPAPPPAKQRVADVSRPVVDSSPQSLADEARVAEEKSVDVYSTVPKGIQQRLVSEEPSDRAAAVGDLARLDADEAFRQICAAFDDESPAVRDEAARSLYSLSDDHAEAFTRALREASTERRRNIGSALASSGLADDAIGQLTGESRDKTYDAFSLLFLMAKAGEVQPLIRAVESHGDSEVRLAVVKLLALSGQQEILPHFRRLAVRGSLPTEVRSAVMEAIYQISSSQPASDTSRVS